jgi:N-acetylated-alpha-linked acidic dipeptidase
MRAAVIPLVAALAITSAEPSAQNARNWEVTFREITNARNIGDYMRRLSARPHHVGSPYGRDNAEWMAGKLREWGWEARIDTYDVLFPTPKEPLVEPFINAVARDIEDPDTKLSVWRRLQAVLIANGPADRRAEARTRPNLRISSLGSGSHYSPLLQHHGTPTLNLGFGGLDDDGIYHSIYDDFYHFSKFLDTDFRYGRALAQTVGTAVLRLADADLLSFEFTSLAETVQTYVADVQSLLKRRQDEVKERNRNIEEGTFATLADPRRPVKAPKIEPPVPAINFAPLDNAVSALARAAERYKKAVDGARPHLSGNANLVAAVNARLIQSERQLTDPAGLPRRPWYRHLLYAPGYYTGYSVKTLPGVREAIEERAYAEAESEVVRVAKSIERETALIEAASADLERIAR